MEAQTIEEKPSIIRSKLHFAEDVLCIASIVIMALMPIMEVIVRNFFRKGIPASSAITVNMLLFAGLIGGMICTRNDKHLAISVVQYLPEGRIRHILKMLSGLVSAFVSVIIAWASAYYVTVIAQEATSIGFVPVYVFTMIIPVSFAVMAIRFAFSTKFTGWKITVPFITLILGTVAAFPLIVQLFWGAEMYAGTVRGDELFELCEKFKDIAYYIKVPLALFFVFAAFGGTPLFIVLGGLSLLFFQTAPDGGEMVTVVTKIHSSLTSHFIIAIPLFTIAGFFLSESTAGQRLVNTFRCFFNWLPGGIIIVSVILCAFFTSFTGASGVTILALGGILYVILSEHLKYPPKFSIGLLTSVGSIGLLFPPSLPLILVSTKLQVPINHIFIGGILPGIILVIMMIVFGIVLSIKIKIPVEKFNLRDALAALKKSIFEILLPFILLAIYFSGFLSGLVEIAAFAVLYVFVVEVFIYRDLKLKDIKRVFDHAIPIIGGILIIIALANAFSDYIIDAKVPDNIASWMQSAFSSKYVFLLILNIALLLIGCFMDMFSAILVVVPLIIPLGEIYGINPLHLGLIFIVNLEVGYITPPVGLNLFLASYRFKKSFIDICGYVAPFLIARLIVVLLVTYIPWLSTFLVSVFAK